MKIIRLQLKIMYPLGVDPDLEGEVIGSSCRCGVDLNGSRLHGIADQNSLVDVFGEDASLQFKSHRYKLEFIKIPEKNWVT
jgi:hypothetical protein